MTTAVKVVDDHVARTVQKMRDRARHSLKLATVMFSCGHDKMGQELEDRGQRMLQQAAIAERYAARRG